MVRFCTYIYTNDGFESKKEEGVIIKYDWYVFLRMNNFMFFKKRRRKGNEKNKFTVNCLCSYVDNLSALWGGTTN